MIKLISDLAKGKLFGHPIHMMLVHFPSALFPLSLFADLAALYFDDGNLHLFSFYAAAAGVVFGWAALVFGIFDLLRISIEQTAFNKALIHGGLGFLWLTIFSVLVGMQIKNYPLIESSSISIIEKAVAVTGLLFSNYLGGDLVLKYGIGKKK